MVVRTRQRYPATIDGSRKAVFTYAFADRPISVDPAGGMEGGSY